MNDKTEKDCLPNTTSQRSPADRRMSITLTKWLLRLGIPVACVMVAMHCGQSFRGAVGVVVATILSVGMAIHSPSSLLSLLGCAFGPIFTLYGRDADKELRNPDHQLFLFFSIPALLWLVAFISTHRVR